MSLLVEDWVSRAGALQRKGRAGRVRPGQCFALYTRHRFEERMKKFQVCPCISSWDAMGMLLLACITGSTAAQETSGTSAAWAVLCAAHAAPL